MKILFGISLLLNMGLVILLIAVSGRRPETISNAALPMVPGQEHQPVADREPPPPAPQGAKSASFHWSQVESTDYRAYIANLRGIGCPEQTIRDIITADVDALYASRREALQSKLKGADPSFTGFLARQENESALAALANEETAALAALLGPAPATSQVAAGTALPSGSERRARESATVSLPLVFQPVDPDAVKLSARQAQAIGDLQQWFADQVGGPDQDPNDPAYRERWLKAQPQIDDLTRGMMGVNAFQDYQLAARASRQKAQENR